MKLPCKCWNHGPNVGEFQQIKDEAGTGIDPDRQYQSDLVHADENDKPNRPHTNKEPSTWDNSYKIDKEKNADTTASDFIPEYDTSKVCDPRCQEFIRNYLKDKKKKINEVCDVCHTKNKSRDSCKRNSCKRSEAILKKYAHIIKDKKQSSISIRTSLKLMYDEMKRGKDKMVGKSVNFSSFDKALLLSTIKRQLPEDINQFMSPKKGKIDFTKVFSSDSKDTLQKKLLENVQTKGEGEKIIAKKGETSYAGEGEDIIKKLDMESKESPEQQRMQTGKGFATQQENLIDQKTKKEVLPTDDAKKDAVKMKKIGDEKSKNKIEPSKSDSTKNKSEGAKAVVDDKHKQKKVDSTTQLKKMQNEGEKALLKAKKTTATKNVDQSTAKFDINKKSSPRKPNSSKGSKTAMGKDINIAKPIGQAEPNLAHQALGKDKQQNLKTTRTSESPKTLLVKNQQDRLERQKSEEERNLQAKKTTAEMEVDSRKHDPTSDTTNVNKQKQSSKSVLAESDKLVAADMDANKKNKQTEADKANKVFEDQKQILTEQKSEGDLQAKKTTGAKIEAASGKLDPNSDKTNENKTKESRKSVDKPIAADIDANKKNKQTEADVANKMVGGKPVAADKDADKNNKQTEADVANKMAGGKPVAADTEANKKNKQTEADVANKTVSGKPVAADMDANKKNKQTEADVANKMAGGKPVAADTEANKKNKQTEADVANKTVSGKPVVADMDANKKNKQTEADVANKMVGGKPVAADMNANKKNKQTEADVANKMVGGKPVAADTDANKKNKQTEADVANKMVGGKSVAADTDANKKNKQTEADLANKMVGGKPVAADTDANKKNKQTEADLANKMLGGKPITADTDSNKIKKLTLADLANIMLGGKPVTADTDANKKNKETTADAANKMVGGKPVAIDTDANKKNKQTIADAASKMVGGKPVAADTDATKKNKQTEADVANQMVGDKPVAVAALHYSEDEIFPTEENIQNRQTVEELLRTEIQHMDQIEAEKKAQLKKELEEKLKFQKEGEDMMCKAIKEQQELQARLARMAKAKAKAKAKVKAMAKGSDGELDSTEPFTKQGYQKYKKRHTPLAHSGKKYYESKTVKTSESEIIVGLKTYKKSRSPVPVEEQLSPAKTFGYIYREHLLAPAPPPPPPPPPLPVKDKDGGQKKSLSKNDRDAKQPQDFAKGILHYALSDPTYIEKGWTILPVEKVVRKVNVYRMRPARPEFDWFERNKNKKQMFYDSGEKLAEFDDNGRGRWYYRNGQLALDYYDSEELNAQQRFVIYSSGDRDDRGRSHPITVLGSFDFLGNGVVFDHGGKIRLKYNQTEGVILDRSLGPVSKWKWHSLNDPPVLQQVMIDTQLTPKDPIIMKLGNEGKMKRQCHDNEEMLAVEFDNFVKERKKKSSIKYQPFQIKMKALKINDQFSLRVIDQATVYLLFRDGTTNLKLNLGMVLDHEEIVDTETAEVGEVSTNVDRIPAATESLMHIQNTVQRAQKVEQANEERLQRLRKSVQAASIDRITAATSRPMRRPLMTVPSSTDAANSTKTQQCYAIRKQPSTNLYYNTRTF